MSFQSFGCRLLPVPQGGFPLALVHYPVRCEHGGVLIELQFITGLEIEPLPDRQRNGDLPFGCNRCCHTVRVRIESQEIKRESLRRFPG